MAAVSHVETKLTEEGFPLTHAGLEDAIYNNIITIGDLQRDIDFHGFVPGFYLIGKRPDGDMFQALLAGLGAANMEGLIKRFNAFNKSMRRQHKGRPPGEIPQVRLQKVTVPHLDEQGRSQTAAVRVDATPFDEESASDFYYTLFLNDGEWVVQEGYQRVQLGGQRSGGGRRVGMSFGAQNSMLDNGQCWALGSVAVLAAIGHFKNRM